MSEEERKIALYCLKANSDYHSEVCEECVNYPNCDHTIQDDVTETIIKALEQQESCEDCISRQAVLDYAKDTCLDLDSFEDTEVFCDEIKLLPPVTSQPKTGHWIKEESIYGWDGHSYQCSVCGRSIHLDTEVEDLEDYPYCHCGVRMELESEVTV